MERVSKYGREPIAPHERVLARVVRTESGCWEFTGALARGYGRVTVGSVADGTRRQRYAHAVVYEALVGEIPSGCEPDHLCRNTMCVNPEHLEYVSHVENVLRGNSPMAINARKTHCPRGHEYDDENTRITPRGSRECRACDREDYHRKRVTA